jgi:hypothetical protein
MGEQIKMLKHHTHLAANASYIGTLCGDFFVVNEDLSGCRLIQKIDAADQSGLAGAGGTNDRNYIAFMDLYVYIL